MIPDQWTIAPLILGTALRDRSQWILLGTIGVTYESAILGWLLLNGNEKILVDTGLGALDTPGVKGLFNRTDQQSIDRQLSRFDTSPQEIRLVINTHLHADHGGGNSYLKHATFLVQKTEMEYAQDPLPVHKPAYDVDLGSISFELLDGDTQITRGLRVILTPGHSPGSQAVVVETRRGPYVVAGDTITHFEHMSVPDDDPFLPGSFYVDLREYYQSLSRLKNLRACILPGHDLLVLNKSTYP